MKWNFLGIAVGMILVISGAYLFVQQSSASLPLLVIGFLLEAVFIVRLLWMVWQRRGRVG